MFSTSVGPCHLRIVRSYDFPSVFQESCSAETQIRAAGPECQQRTGPEEQTRGVADSTGSGGVMGTGSPPGASHHRFTCSDDSPVLPSSSLHHLLQRCPSDSLLCDMIYRRRMTRKSCKKILDYEKRAYSSIFYEISLLLLWKKTERVARFRIRQVSFLWEQIPAKLCSQPLFPAVLF